MQHRLHRANLFTYQRTETLCFHPCFPYTCKIPSHNEFLKGIGTDSSDGDTRSSRHRKSLTRDVQNSPLPTKQGHVTYTTQGSKKKQSLLDTKLFLSQSGQKSQHNALPYIFQKTHVHLDKNISAGSSKLFKKKFFSSSLCDYSQHLNSLINLC